MGCKWMVESVVNNHLVKDEVWAHTEKEAREYVQRMYGSSYSHSCRTTRIQTTYKDYGDEYAWRRDRGLLK